MGRRFAYWAAAFNSGYRWLIALAGVVGALVAIPPVALWGLSGWTALVFVITGALMMLAEGTYQLHRKSEAKRQEALAEVQQRQGRLHAQEQELRALRGGHPQIAAVHIEGGHHNVAYDNTLIVEHSRETPPPVPEEAPVPPNAQRAIEDALRRRRPKRPDDPVEPPSAE